ncbi:MAG: terpene cyclase/mutase family protein [Oscillospiraceae bacterium]|nr:terpene cyclase/mutase family protein [Oscillospiraceae bacterium]
MRKKWIMCLALLLCVCCLCSAASAAGGSAAQQAEQAFCKIAGCKTGELLAQEDWMSAGNSGSDWMAFVFAVNGVPEKYGSYLSALETYVTQQYARQGCLDTVLATEYHRIALSVLALGGDPTAFGTDGNGKSVDLVADGVWNFKAGVSKQGLNGLVYALITLDAKGYAVPADAKIDRQWILNQILALQNEDGGFGFMPGRSDVDMTAMTLTALAPYKELYMEQIESALRFLSVQQGDDGQYLGFGEPNAESVAQVILALSSLGIDPAQDERYRKNGVTLPEALDAFRLEDGTYCHIQGDPSDPMATEQALMALTALNRLRSGGSRLYDFTNYVAPIVEKSNSHPLKAVILTAAGVVVLAAVTTAVITGIRRKKHAITDQ